MILELVKQAAQLQLRALFDSSRRRVLVLMSSRQKHASIFIFKFRPSSLSHVTYIQRRLIIQVRETSHKKGKRSCPVMV